MYVNFFSPVCLKRQLKFFPSYLMSIKLFKARGILKEANSETKLAPLKEITTAPRPLVRNSERIVKNVCLVSLLSNYFSFNNWDSWSYTIDILFQSQKKLEVHGKSEPEYDVHEDGERKVDRTTKDDWFVSLWYIFKKL